MKLLLIISLALCSVTSFANLENCEVRSVGLSDYSNALKGKIEEVLLEKGYGVVSDGDLYVSGNVPISDLKIRPDLLVPGNLILIDYELGITFSNTACEVWSNDLVNCSTHLSLFYINQDRRFVKVAEINENIRPKATFFRSVGKINKDFDKNVIAKAKKLIPQCKSK